MANPTTNYGWVLPTPTDLVTDLPADFDVALQGVDTTTKALNPSTTLGDIEYRSSTANTNTRLGIGTTGQVLTVAGGVPSWASASGGGRTLISTTSLTGASVTLSSIPQTYKSLFLEIYGVTNATADGFFVVNANNATNGIQTAVLRGISASTSSSGNLVITGNNFPDRTSANNVWSLSFDNYTSTTNYKSLNWSGVFLDTTGANCSIVGGGGLISNTEITSIVIKNLGGNLSTGTVELYGVN